MHDAREIALLVGLCMLEVGCQPPNLAGRERTETAEQAISDQEVRVENFDDHIDIQGLSDPDFGRLAFALDGRAGLWLRNQNSSGAAPRWGQVMANYDIYNVRDFGADPTGGSDSSAAIQLAIAAATTDGAKAGIIYFPAGEYRVDDPIVLPRDPFPLIEGTHIWRPFDAPITLLGAGVGATTIVEGTTSNFDVDDATIDFDPVSGSSVRPTTAYRFERMTIASRTNGTHAFRFVANAESDRGLYFSFRDVRFASNNTADFPTVYIKGAFNGSMENVLIHGASNGGVGLHLRDSAQWTLRDVQFVFQDGDLWKGLLIEGGGEHVLQNIRINGTNPFCPSGGSCEGGVGLHAKDTDFLEIEMLVGEGIQGERFVLLENASNVHFRSLVTPSPKNYINSTLPYYGLYIDEGSHNITWHGGFLGSVETATGHAPGSAMRVEDGATDILIQHVTYGGSAIETLEEPTTLDLPTDLRFEAKLHDLGGGVWTKVVGASRAVTLANAELDARGLKVATIQMPGTGGGTLVLDRIVNGSGAGARLDCTEGATLTLIVENNSGGPSNGVLVRSVVAGSNLRLNGVWQPTPSDGRAATMQLVCDGQTWVEVSRVAEVAGP